MVQTRIHEEACRGCQMCVDVCPTKVFAFDEQTQKAKVANQEHCFSCLSCVFLCPSGAISETGYYAVRNFYRDLEISQRMERFL